MRLKIEMISKNMNKVIILTKFGLQIFWPLHPSPIFRPLKYFFIPNARHMHLLSCYAFTPMLASIIQNFIACNLTKIFLMVNSGRQASICNFTDWSIWKSNFIKSINFIIMGDSNWIHHNNIICDEHIYIITHHQNLKFYCSKSTYIADIPWLIIYYLYLF